MRNSPLLLVCAAFFGAALAPAVQAQTASPTTPSQRSTGGNAAPIGPSGGTVSPMRNNMAGKPAIGGTTQEDMQLEKKLDHDMTICKGC